MEKIVEVTCPRYLKVGAERFLVMRVKAAAKKAKRKLTWIRRCKKDKTSGR
jgi:hypothetical protein